MYRRTALGLSLYDVHNDGSVVVYPSPRDRFLNMKPDYIHWALHRPREFSADLMMIGFLGHLNIPYDVLTDHDLHFAGQSGCSNVDITKYDVLITGCHPEYPTLESLNTYRSSLRDGGSLMYLGGNGFYWAASLDKKGPTPKTKFEGRLEVRRGDQGIRTHAMHGGERHFSTN